jgi:hypothetical protein
MKGRAAVTLSNENSPSRFRPCQESRPTASVRQRPSCGPRQPNPSTLVHQLDAGRLGWAQ